MVGRLPYRYVHDAHRRIGANNQRQDGTITWHLILINPMMRGVIGLLAISLFSTSLFCEDRAQALPTAPERADPLVHRFWDGKNILLFSGVAVFRGLDYASTRNMLARGREEVLLPDDVVNNTAGFASLEAAAALTSVGISYIFHRTGHHKLERWVSIGHIGVTGFGVVRNYSLKSAY